MINLTTPRAVSDTAFALHRHRLTARQMVEMDLSVRQKVEVLGLALSGVCVLFLLGNYGAQGTFGSVGEEAFLLTLMITGGLLFGIISSPPAHLPHVQAVHAEARQRLKREEDHRQEGGKAPGQDRIQDKVGELLHRELSDLLAQFQ